jgi:hypothetical protein
MSTVLEECTTKEQLSVVLFFLWAKGFNSKDIRKELFLFEVGSVCSVRQFTAGTKDSLKDIRKSQMMTRRCGSG